MYPTKMEANGNIYPINTDYRVALTCFKALYDTEITDLERFYAIETLLLGENVNPLDEHILKGKIKQYLSCGKDDTEEISEDEIDYDYIQDEKLTKTSIRQCYHLNLNDIPYMHWYEYNELISGLTSESIVNKVRDLRNYDTSDIKDEKEKARIINAQQRVAIKRELPKTDREKEIDKIWDDILG